MDDPSEGAIIEEIEKRLSFGFCHMPGVTVQEWSRSLSKTKDLSMPMRTDQRSCYGAGGAEIPCAGTGQDGDLNKGRSWPEPRFEVDGDQVLDRLTGSVWTRSANLPGFPLTWAEGWRYVEEMNRRSMFGRSDWTLPSRSGLFSLISHARVNPALPAEHPFVDVFSGYYWTGEGVARYPSQSWYIHLGGGRVFKGMKHGSYMVWPVVEPTSYAWVLHMDDGAVGVGFKQNKEFGAWPVRDGNEILLLSG